MRRLRTNSIPNRGHPLNQGKLAWWLTMPHLYGGPALVDIWGGNNGTLTSMANSSNGWRSTTRPGGWGSLLVDGTAGYVATPALGATTANSALAGWFLATSTPPNYAGLIVARSGSGFVFGLYSMTGNHLSFIQGGGFGSSGPVYPTGSWFFAALVLNPGYATFALGVPSAGTFTVATFAATGPSQTYSAGFNLGWDSSSSSRYWPGKLDDCQVWAGNRLATTNPSAFLAGVYDQSRRGYPDMLNYANSAAFAATTAVASKTPISLFTSQAGGY